MTLMNIKYKMKVYLAFTAWYMLIAVPILFILYYILIETDVINSSTGSVSYRLWGLIIFLFAISIRFKEDFDFMITLSSTRAQIFQSLIGISLIISAIFSGVIVLERIVIDHLNNSLGLIAVKDFFHYLAPYATDNLFLEFVFFLALCFFYSIFGILIGSLSYRFGKKFMIGFWLVFSAIPTVVLPLYLWVLYLNNELSDYIKTMVAFSMEFDLIAVSGELLFMTIIFGFASWINIRRLPQR